MIDIKAHLDIADDYLAMIYRKYQYKIGLKKWSHYFLTRIPVAYPGGCIACACTPGGLRGAPKRRGEKERSKERERKKGKKRGAKEGEKGRERKYAKEKEKREEIKRK